MIVCRKSRKILCTDFSAGKKHDFKLLKESKARVHPQNTIVVDSGYQGLQKTHPKTQLPQKSRKNHPLSKKAKQSNTDLARNRVLNENVIGILKRFKIISDQYRNRRKRSGLRFNLISAIYNLELDS